MGWFQNFVNNSPHLFGEDSDFSESDSEDEGNDEIEEIMSQYRILTKQHYIYVLIVRLENKI